MLTAIRVGNFKAFADPQRIPIRPLTLIYGANSSGKSSILHSLIFARHALETGELDVHRTTVGGESVDLGGFRQFVHHRNADSNVQFEWEINTASFSDRLHELLPGIKRASIGLSIGYSNLDKALAEAIGSITPQKILDYLVIEAQKKNDRIEEEKLKSLLATAEDKLTFEEVSRVKSKLRIEACWLVLNNSKFMNMSIRSSGHLQLDTFDREHPATRFLIENLIKAFSTTDHVDQDEINALGATIDGMVPRISFTVSKLFPSRLIEPDDTGNPLRVKSLVTVKKETRPEDLKKVIELYLPSILEEILIGISEQINFEINQLSYLGPLRAYPPRHIGFTQEYDPNWIAGGGSAWDIARKDPAIRQRINEWLGDEKKLSTAYELRLRYLLTMESIRSKLSELATRATSKFWESNDPSVVDAFYTVEDEIDAIPDKLAKMESLFAEVNEVVLFDKRTNTSVSHRDVGIGISQVLPVLVTCFASQSKLIAMEQPEIHLHPALQAELGDVFIEAALSDRKNALLIETHSEHLLLRVMRRMRETSNGELPEGIHPITPKDVCVLFVEPKGISSVVRHLELDEEGQLLDPWPGGFFEEGYRERFA